MWQKYIEKYENELTNSVVPFWEKYCVDREFGGYFTSLDRDGSVYDTYKSPQNSLQTQAPSPTSTPTSNLAQVKESKFPSPSTPESRTAQNSATEQSSAQDSTTALAWHGAVLQSPMQQMASPKLQDTP